MAKWGRGRSGRDRYLSAPLLKRGLGFGIGVVRERAGVVLVLKGAGTRWRRADDGQLRGRGGQVDG